MHADHIWPFPEGQVDNGGGENRQQHAYEQLAPLARAKLPQQVYCQEWKRDQLHANRDCERHDSGAAARQRQRQYRQQQKKHHQRVDFALAIRNDDRVPGVQHDTGEAAGRL